jgi:transcriptional regulator with XRE-family HTH domain
MIDNQVVSRIAQKIRTTRLEKNLTLHELAVGTQVTKGLLSKIENMRTIPSLPVLVTLIHSLEISLKEFFEDMERVNGKPYLLIRKNQHTPMGRDQRSGLSGQFILSQNVTHCTVEVFHIAVEPGTSGNLSSFNGYEFKYTLSGKCQFDINDELLELDGGDSIYFNASTQHVVTNTTKTRMMLFAAIIFLRSCGRHWATAILRKSLQKPKFQFQ